MKLENWNYLMDNWGSTDQEVQDRLVAIQTEENNTDADHLARIGELEKEVHKYEEENRHLFTQNTDLRTRLLDTGNVKKPDDELTDDDIPTLADLAKRDFKFK